MKKTLIMAIIAILLLSACATQSQTATPQAATQAVVATPDTSMSTPTVGSATIRSKQGAAQVILYLYSQPDPKAPVIAKVKSGTKGEVLGVTAAENWTLVKFGDQTGWAPSVLLNLVIAQ